MQSSRYIVRATIVVLFAGLCASAQAADTRAGNCEDAKKQMEFFCDPNSTDMMSQFTACTNAKKNMAAACDGKVEEDKPYTFDDKKK